MFTPISSWTRQYSKDPTTVYIWYMYLEYPNLLLKHFQDTHIENNNECVNMEKIYRGIMMVPFRFFIYKFVIQMLVAKSFKALWTQKSFFRAQNLKNNSKMDDIFNWDGQHFGSSFGIVKQFLTDWSSILEDQYNIQVRSMP